MASFFNQISLKGLDQIDYLDLNDICVKSDELHDLFESRRSEIKIRINLTGRKLLSKDNDSKGYTRRKKFRKNSE